MLRLRGVEGAIWLEAYHDKRRSLAQYTHLQIPRRESRMTLLHLLSQNPAIDLGPSPLDEHDADLLNLEAR